MLRAILLALAAIVFFALAVSLGLRFFNNTGPLAVHSPPVALGDLRTLVSAQSSYQAGNGGFYEGRLQCLNRPAECLPGYAPHGPTFLDEVMAAPRRTRARYLVVFHAGPPAPPAEIARAKASASSVTSFACTWVPEDAGRVAFCGDASGRICRYKPGVAPVVRDGACLGVGAGGVATPECEVVQ